MKKIFLIVTLIVAVAFISHAQKQTPPPGGPAKDFKLSAKKSQQYANGLKSVMVHYGDVPKTTITLIVKTGNIHETVDQIWLADLTGRLLREGTSDLNFAALSKKAAVMGGSLNVNVGMAQTTISGSVLAEFAPDFIKLISALVTKPAFPASETERIKADLRRNMTVQKSVPQSMAQEQFFQALYGSQRYGKTFPDEATINNFTAQSAKDFYEQNFGAKRSVLYIVGNFEDAAVNAAIAGSLSKWKPGPAVSYPKITENAVSDSLIIDRKNAPQTTIILGLPVVTPDNKDYIPMLVTNSLLGGSFGSRITTNIRENKGYTYSPSSTLNNRKGSTLWYEQADVTSEHTVEAMQEIEKEIKKLQSDAPTKEELDGIINYQSGIFVLQNSSPAGIIGQLNFLDLYGLDDSYLTNYVKNIHSITPAKVSEMAQRYIQYNKMVKVMVGDKTSIGQQAIKKKEKPRAF